jgi:nitrate reductase NapE component
LADPVPEVAEVLPETRHELWNGVAFLTLNTLFFPVVAAGMVRAWSIFRDKQ